MIVVFCWSCLFLEVIEVFDFLPMFLGDLSLSLLSGVSAMYRRFLIGVYI